MADPVHLGKTWQDMPGSDKTDKMMSFALFRRGKLSLEYVEATGLQRARMNNQGTCNGFAKSRAQKARKSVLKS